MKGFARRFRRGGCGILATALLVSLFVTTVQPGNAGVLDTIKRGIDEGRRWVIGIGAIPAGLVMGLVGAAVLGIALGPIGLIAGGIGGYFLGKGLFHLIFSGQGKVAMTLLGITGAILGSSMGLPGAVLGGMIGAAIGKFLASGRLFSVATPASAAAQDEKAMAYINHVQKQGTSPQAAQDSTALAPKPMLRVTSSLKSFKAKVIEKYQAAYRKYTEAVQKGDPEETKASYVEYKKSYGEYQKVLGKEAR